MEAGGISQNELARRIGTSQPTVWKILNGRSQSTVHLRKIAKELGTSEEYLLGETDDPRPGVLPIAAVENSDDDTVKIDAIDLSFGLGGSFLDSDTVEAEKITFSRSWLRQFTQAPAQMLFSTRGIGDSMMPSIHDRDIVIVDRSQSRLEGNVGDKFWAIVFGGVGMIKRLRPMPDGTVKIMSDNQVVRDEVATDGDLFIVGRVVAIVKSV